MTVVTIKVTGLPEINQKLQKLGRELYKMSDAMTAIGKRVVSYSENEVFTSQGGVFGHAWEPLSPVTLVARGINGVEIEDSAQASFAAHLLKRRLKSGGAISRSIRPLEDTGKMRHDFYFKAGNTMVEVGNKADYFKYHQSTDPRHRLPRRQMLGVNSDIENITKDEIQKDVRKKLDSA